MIQDTAQRMPHYRHSLVRDLVLLNEAASAAEFLEVLLALPKELSELYKRLLQNPLFLSGKLL